MLSIEEVRFHSGQIPAYKSRELERLRAKLGFSYEVMADLCDSSCISAESREMMR